MNPDYLRQLLDFHYWARDRVFEAVESISAGQMVAHVVNDATYHRGQVTTMLRALGAAPAQSTDMIRYFREHAG